MLFVTLLVTSPGGKMSYSLKEGADSLEEVFFIKQDQKLIEKLRELKRMEESKEALAQVSGITDDKVLGELVKLEIRPEILAALALIPLVEIAWVDGKLDDKEREAILDSTKKTGLLGGDIDRAILEEWFNHRPDRKLLEAWALYTKGLCSKLGEDQVAILKIEILGHARQVAEASGGLLGLGQKTSAKENEMLQELEKAFRCS
jgi:hypothetical protein